MNENSNVQVSEVKNGRKGDKSQFSELSEKSLTAKQADMPEKQQQINFCSKSSHEVIGEENECKEKVTMSCLDPSEHDHTQVINQAIAELSEDLVSSVSTNHEKTRFAKVWYPNGIPEADALLQYRPSRYESLNTDSDISELDEEENERLVVSKDNNANFKATVPENYPEIVESSFQSVGDRNAAFSSASPGRSLETELEFYAETQSSHKMDSMMLSDGNFPSQNVGTLWKQLMKERKDRQECIFLMEQLQLDYDNLLQKYARAENAIDVLRIYKGNEANNYPRPSYSKDYLHHQPLAKPGCNNDDGDDLDFSQPITNHKRSSKSSRKRTSFSDLPSNSASQNTTEGIPEPEFKFNLVHPNTATNTNLPFKPSVISLQLRANCLEDQINLALLEMQDQKQSSNMCGNCDAVEQYKSNLNLLVHDYKELGSLGSAIGFEGTIERLRKLLNELEDSCQKSNHVIYPKADYLGRHSFKNNIPPARTFCHTQYSPMMCRASDSSCVSHRCTSNKKERHHSIARNSSSDNTLQLATEKCRSNSSNEVYPNYSRRSIEPRRISWPPSMERQSVMMANWSMNSCFGKINASLCIDKQVRSSPAIVDRQDQMLGMINNERSELIVSSNLNERSHRIASKSIRNERHLDNSGLDHVSGPSVAGGERTRTPDVHAIARHKRREKKGIRMTKEERKEVISHRIFANSIWNERHMNNSGLNHVSSQTNAGSELTPNTRATTKHKRQEKKEIGIIKEENKEVISHRIVANSIWNERHSLDKSGLNHVNSPSIAGGECTHEVAPNTRTTTHKNREKKGIGASKQESREAISLATEESDARVAKLKMLLTLHSADKKAYHLHKKSGEILSRICNPPNSISSTVSNLYY